MIQDFYNDTNGNEELPSMMLAVVTNNNDPQQNGRIQVLIPSLSEHEQHLVEDQLPWASYVSPIGGINETSHRGPGNNNQDINSPYGETTTGSVCYGMWAIPKVGARVLVVAVDNDPNQLYWLGCVFPNSSTHTLPHGRYVTGVEGKTPEGPLSSTEQPIEPLRTNLELAFGSDDSHEWRTRGADYSVSAISSNRLGNDITSDENTDHTGTVTNIADDKDTVVQQSDGNSYGNDGLFRQGYAVHRTDPEKDTNDDYHAERNKRTDRHLEPTTTSFTTPGFHSISMDDRPENCRVKLRTTTGHQIIMDDTNERIYVSTNEGRNWIEMDSDGHIFVYSEESISMKAEGDINLTSEAKVRITAKDGIHMKSGAEFRLHVSERTDMVFDKDLLVHVKDADSSNSHIIFEKDLLIHNKANFDWIVDRTVEINFRDDVDIHCNANVRCTIDNNIHWNVGANWYLTTGLSINIECGSSMHTDVGSVYSIDTSNEYSVGSTNFNIDPSGNLDITNGLKTGSDIEAGGDVSTPAGNSIDIHEHDYIDTITVSHGNQPTTKTTVSHTGGSVSVSSSPPPWGGISADISTDASQASQAYEAFWTTLTPSHEPWARNFQSNTDNDAVTMDNNLSRNDHTILEFQSNDDPDIGRDMRLDYSKTPTIVINDLSRKGDRPRNPLWHR